MCFSIFYSSHAFLKNPTFSQFLCVIISMFQRGPQSYFSMYMIKDVTTFYPYICIFYSYVLYDILSLHFYFSIPEFLESWVPESSHRLKNGRDLNKRGNAACKKTDTWLSLPPHHLNFESGNTGRSLYEKKGLSIIHVLLAIRCIALDKCGVWIIENLTTTSTW
jgi:hypothetical protein